MKRIITLFITIGILLGSIIIISLTLSKRTKEVSEPVTDQVEQEKVVEKIPEPADGGTLKLSMNNPESLNPLYVKDEGVKQVFNMVYDSLVSINDKEKPVPSLAKSFEASVDGTYITVVLRDDVVWHDGTKFTSKDVGYTIDKIKDTKAEVKSTYLNQVENISYYKIIDDNTIQINLKQTHSAYLYSFTFPILPAHVVEEGKMVGTGAYKFVDYVEMQYLKLAKNEQYFKGKAYIDNIKVVLTRVGDDEAKVSSFETGIINALNVNQVDWGKFSSKESWTINPYTTYYYDFIGINFNNSLLAKRSVRQGIMNAINRQELVKDALLGHGVVTDSPIHPDSWLNKDQLVAYPYNVEEAKAALEGVEGLSFEILVPEAETSRVDIANKIKEDLAKVGVELTVTPLPMETFISRVTGGNFDLYYGGWHLSKMPDFTFAYSSVGTANYGKYENATMDQLLNTAFKAEGEKNMKMAYDELATYIEKEVPYLSLFFRQNTVMTDNRVYGEVKPTESNLYRTITQWYLPELQKEKK